MPQAINPERGRSAPPLTQSSAGRQDAGEKDRRSFEAMLDQRRWQRRVAQPPIPEFMPWQSAGGTFAAPGAPISDEASQADSAALMVRSGVRRADSADDPSSDVNRADNGASARFAIRQTGPDAWQCRVVSGPWAGLELQAALRGGVVALTARPASRAQRERLASLKPAIEAQLADPRGRPIRFELSREPGDEHAGME